MNKRYQFIVDGKTYFKNVSPINEEKFFNLYGKYNPILVEADQSQDNQQQKDTKLKPEDSSLVSLENKTFLDNLATFIGVTSKAKRTGIDPSDYDGSKEKKTFIEETPLGKNFVTNLMGDIIRSAKSGKVQNESLAPSLKLYSEGSAMSDEDYLDLVRKGRAMEEFGPTDEMIAFDNRYKEIEKAAQALIPGDEKGVSGFAGSTLAFMKGWWENPTVMAQYSTQSLANMALSAYKNPDEILKGGLTGVGTAVIAGQLGPQVGLPEELVTVPTGFIAGSMGAISRTMEIGFTTAELIQQAATDNNMDWAKMNDQERVDWYKKVANDKELFDDITDKALRRGNTIGLIDGLTAIAVPGGSKAISTRVAMSRASGLTGVSRVGASAAIETGGGMLSEYYGQKAAGQEVNAQEILIEGFADKSLTGIEIGKALISKTPKYKINGEELNGRDFDRALRIMDDETYMLADIEVENSPTVKKVVTDRTNSIVIDQGIDSRISDVNDRAELIKLETRKQELKDTNNKIELNQIEEKINELNSKYKDSTVDIDIENRKKAVALAIEEKIERRYNKNLAFAKEGAEKIGINFNVAKDDKQLQQYIDKLNANLPKDEQVNFNEAKESDGFIIGDTIVINEKKAKQTGQINVGAHELLHGVVAKHMQSLNISEQTKLIKSFKNTLTSDQFNYIKNIIEERNKAGENLDINSTEEWLTVFSDGITKGDVTFNEGVFSKMMNVIQEILRKYGINKEFQNGRQVYNFMKDYQASIKKGELSSRAIKLAGEDVFVKEAKASKSQNPQLDKLGKIDKDGKPFTSKTWESEGYPRAMEAIKGDEFIRNIIRKKYKVPEDRPEKWIDDVIGSPEFQNMIKRFNTQKKDGKRISRWDADKKPEQLEDQSIRENESLFAYINDQLEWRAGDVYKAFGEGEVKGPKVETDAVTPEGQPVVQLEDADTRMERFEEQDMTRRDKNVQDSTPAVRERKSTFRQEIGIKGIGKGIIFREVKKALRVAGAITDPKKFLKKYEEILAGSLFDYMKKIFPDANTMVKYRMAILESIPLSTLKKWQKELPAKDNDGNDFGNIFVKNHGRRSDQDFLSDFMDGTNLTGENPRKKKLLPDLKKLWDDGARGLSRKDAVKNPAGKEYYRRKGAGITLWERLPVNSTTWESYVNGNFIGKRQEAKGSGTAGNNRIKILEQSAVAIGKDATPENLTTEFIEDYISENKLKGKMTVEGVREAINETIDRPPSLKFSYTPESAKFEATKMQENTKESIGKGIKVPFVYKKIPKKNGKYKKVVDWSATAQEAGREARTVFNAVKESASMLIQEFPQHYQTIKVLTTKSDRGTIGSVKTLNKMIDAPKLVQEFFAKWGYSETGTRHLNTDRVRYNKNKKIIEFNVGTLKQKQKWISSNEFAKQQLLEVNGLIEFANDIKAYLDKHPDQKWFIVSILKDSTNNMDAITRTGAPMMATPVNAKNKPLTLMQIIEEHVVPQNIIVKLLLYGIENNKLSDVTKVIKASYMQLPLLKDHNNQLDSSKLTQTMPKFFWEFVVPGILDGSIDIKDGLAGIVRYTAAGIDLNNYYLNNKGKTITEEFGVGRFQNASEFVVDNQNELIEKVLIGEITKQEAKKIMKEVIKLDNTLKISKPQLHLSKSTRKAHQTINRFRKSGKMKGMSTFDFDETLIIDGENFVIATDPTTGQEVEISSAEWPTKGPELAAMGYDMNFDDFVNVRGGVDGPLLQKMKNQIKKYGAENVFVLTARPQSADIAIHEWLKSKGIDIPFKNITGLANSTGQAKADWMIEKFAEGYNDMYFVDDALSNVKAVREILDQLDIKSKVVQAKTKVEVGPWLVDITTQEGRDFIKRYNEIETVSTTDPDLANRKIKFSKSTKNTANKFMDEFNKVVESRKKATKLIEDDLRKRGYKILPTTSSSEFKRIGGWIIDTRTKEGRKFVRDLENIPTIGSSEFGPGHYSVGGKIYKGKYPDGKLVSKNGVKFSKSPSVEFNEILEQKRKIEAGKVFSAAEARKIGIGKGKNIFKNFFVPPSAEDFKGFLYAFIGKGEQGNAHAAFFKEKLLDPFAKGIRDWNSYKQAMSDDYKALKRQFNEVGKQLNKKVKGTPFTNDNAIRVYLWDKAGFEIPGLSEEQKTKLIDHINNNPELKHFAEGLSIISRTLEGYVEPNEFWSIESIASDLNNIVRDKGRKDFLAEWINNKNIIFSPENLNKIEAIYGTGFRNELEKMLYRMETGKNRLTGKDSQVNWMLDWINGSVGAVMFFNMRSATLQTISMANFINMSDNNPVAAAAALANSKQFIKDFVFIFNSDMLKQRRAGLQMDVSASELTRAFVDGKSKPQAIIHWLLEKGFTPTQIADSFAIAAGGAPFYRNRLKTYLKQGMSESKAKEQAWLDFQEVAEETQQSSRPDLISNQQAGPLGRLVLAWQNTPMQMTRLMKKKLSDFVNRRRIPGYTQFQSDMANISGIAYYGLIQNIYFGALQTGLMFMLFGWDDDEEKKERLEKRVANGALDSILRGTGIYGAGVSTLKNVLLKWREEADKPGWKRENMNIAQEAVNLSPPMGTKMRKIMKAVRTEEWNKGVSKEIGWRIENPNLSIVANWVEALTNLPVARMIDKANNIEEALTGNHQIWQKVALISGWSKWSVGVEDEELEKAKIKAEEQRAIDKKTEKEEKKKDALKTGKIVRCSGTKSNGERCKLTTAYSQREQVAFKGSKKKTWLCPHHAPFKPGQDRDGDGKKEYQCRKRKSNGQRCKNKTENKNQYCYAHQ